MKIKRICKQCGKEFEVKPSIIKNGGGIFCSRNCKDNAQQTQIERVCKYCGKNFKVRPSKIKKGVGIYCSRRCKNNAQKRQIRMVCKYCGKEFFSIPSIIKNKKGIFCSRKCLFAARKGKQICLICGKKFKANPYRIKNGWGRYCSHSCSRQAHKFPKHHTKPELIFEQICKNNNLPFKYTGDGSFWIGKKPSINPDFVECNGKKIAVEIFGDYWHSPLLNPKLKERSTLTYRKKILKKYGWKLIVFWENDLKREDVEQFILSQLRSV